MWSVMVIPKLHVIKKGWYNAVDFGIIGDGTTNNSTALQSLIDKVSNAGGGTIYFPPGTYYLASGVTLKENVTLQGAGIGPTTLSGYDGYTRITLGGTRTVIRDFNLLRLGIVAGTSASPAYILGSRLENLRFIGPMNNARIELYVASSFYNNINGIAIENVSIEPVIYQTPPLVVLGGGNVTFRVNNCFFYYEKPGQSANLIVCDGGYISMENINFECWSGNFKIIYVNAGTVYLNNISYHLWYDTKTLVHVANQNSRCILGTYGGDTLYCTFNVAGGYTDNIAFPGDARFKITNPGGNTGLSLPTERRTYSTSYVTLKSFRTAFAGEFRLRVDGYNNDPEYYGHVRIRKNGQNVYETYVEPGSEWTVTRDIAVNKGDLIEIQCHVVDPSYYMSVTNVTGDYKLYMPGHFYDLVD